MDIPEIKGLDEHIHSFRADLLTTRRTGTFDRADLRLLRDQGGNIRFAKVNYNRIRLLEDWMEHACKHVKVDLSEDFTWFDENKACGYLFDHISASPVIDVILGKRRCYEDAIYPKIDLDARVKEELSILYDSFVVQGDSCLYNHITKRFFRLKKLRFLNTQLCKIMRFLYQLFALAREKQLSLDDVFLIVSIFEACFQGLTVENVCPGIVIHAAPGVGKTHFALSNLMVFDVENLNNRAINADPHIISRLAKSGLSLLTNRWEYLIWDANVISIRARNLITSLRDVNIYPRKMSYQDFMRSKRTYFYNHKYHGVPLEVWTGAYRRLDELPQVWLKDGQKLVHGLEKFSKMVIKRMFDLSEIEDSTDDEICMCE